MRPLLVFGVIGLALLAPASASASVLQMAVQRGSFYSQTAPDVTPGLVDYQYLLSLGTTGADDVGSVDVSFLGGLAPTISLQNPFPGVAPALWSAGASVATEAELFAAVPSTVVTFSVAGGTLGAGSADVDITTDVIPATIPQFDAATFNGLQGMDPSADFLVSFNGFTPFPGATLSQVGLTFSSLSHGTGILAPDPSATSILVPAGTLHPDTEYFVGLVYQNFVYTPVLAPGPFFGANGVQHGGRGTTISIHTAVPEPGTTGLLAIGLLLMRGGRRRRRS